MNKIIITLLSAALALLIVSCSSVDEVTDELSHSEESFSDGTSEKVTEDAWIDKGEPIVTNNVLDPGGFDEDDVTDDGPTPNETKNPPENVTTGIDTEFSGVDYSKFSYEDYINMSAQQQSSFIKSFPSVGKFTEWYNEAKAEYDKNNGHINIGEDTIDISDIFKD